MEGEGLLLVVVVEEATASATWLCNINVEEGGYDEVEDKRKGRKG